jgi:glycosyltransferase involved in cell wall biosynthesis
MAGRVLVLSYLFPPAAEAEGWCTAKAFAHLDGYDVDVICAEPFRSKGQDHSLDGYVAARFAQVERIGVPQALGHLPFERMGLLFNAPDAHRWLNPRVRRIARRLGLHRYDALISRSQHHSVHLAAGALARQRDAPPWLACFSDPWSTNPFVTWGSLARRVNARLELQVLHAADRIVVTSPVAADDLVGRYSNEVQGRTEVIPHAFDAGLYPTGPVDRSGPLVLRHLGRFYKQRTPAPLFAGLARLLKRQPKLASDIQLELIGWVNPRLLNAAAYNGLPIELVRVIPPVDHVTSLGQMATADVLVNVDAITEQSIFLPSKVVDYAGAGRPIVTLSAPGPAADLVRRLGGWVADPRQPEAVAEALASAIEWARDSQTREFGAPDVRREHEARAVASQFTRVVASLR